MRRIAAALLCALLLLFSCASAEEGFAPLRFCLWGNLSRGYAWSCEYQRNGVLSDPMQDFVADAGLPQRLLAGFEALAPMYSLLMEAVEEAIGHRQL